MQRRFPVLPKNEKKRKRQWTAAKNHDKITAAVLRSAPVVIFLRWRQILYKTARRRETP